MERRAIAIYGTVQGVGFRPFVHNLASRLSLNGFVRNQAGAVQIEIEGEKEPLDKFLAELTQSPPPLARIEQITWQPRVPRGRHGFEIQPSESGSGPIAIPADFATCDACLAELFDPTDRRYHYPFINCTHCGPRLTIVRGAPYDRSRTTMAEFPMCRSCQREYEDPNDRRFHAQPVACPVCGPQLSLLNAAGEIILASNPLELFVTALLNGQIGALKGLGGYHLACDATNSTAVATLRQRKARDEKPFAVMVRDLESTRLFCEIDEAEAGLLIASARPIVLLRKRPPGSSPDTTHHSAFDTAALSQNAGADDKNRGVLADKIAPQNPFLGVMLPYTPLHHLLMQAVGRPLVMTSGNRSDEPIAYQTADALERLSGIADLFLTHNRPIHVRCDDSVTRIMGRKEAPIRRSRGYAPHSIALPIQCPAPLLAVGGQLKSTFALGNGNRAILSHHMGDLDHFQAYCAFERDIALYEDLFATMPTHIVHDMHPDYASTHYARGRKNVGHIAVQHHHAHIASCMAEHGLKEKVIGIAFDGSGFGPDGAIWGGEFLIADYLNFERAGHLLYVPLPGGEQAVREPWRMAASYLAEANAQCGTFEQRISSPALRAVRQMIEKKLNSPLTSSMGRMFDAVASLCGVRDVVSYEGQAAVELEGLADKIQQDGSYPFRISGALQIGTRPTMRAIVADVNHGIDAALIARRFHTTVVNMIVAVCRRLRTASKLKTVVLSGGVFLNAILSLETEQRLGDEGFSVYRHEKVPCNDGGLCLGQLAIAAAQLQP